MSEATGRTRAQVEQRLEDALHELRVLFEERRLPVIQPDDMLHRHLVLFRDTLAALREASPATGEETHECTSCGLLHRFGEPCPNCGAGVCRYSPRPASVRLTPAESENDPTDALIVHRLRAWCARWIAVKDKTDPWYHAAEELSRTMFQPIGAGSPARQESQMSNGPFDPAIPRRIDLRRNTPAELSIRAAIHEVEKVGAEVRLTDAVTLLGAALYAVADFTDATQPIIRRLWYPKEELLPEAQVSQGHADSARLTPTENGELSPCPFCGGRASIIAVSEPSNVGGYVVQCEGCEASTRVWFPVKDDVRVLLTQAWNRRASARLPTPELLASRAPAETPCVCDEARGYLSRLIKTVWPQIRNDGDLLMLCTQVDNGIAGLLERAPAETVGEPPRFTVEPPHICGDPLSACDAECMTRAYDAEARRATPPPDHAALVQRLEHVERFLVGNGEFSQAENVRDAITALSARPSGTQEDK